MALRLFAALADSVRDYAIFLMDPDGIITCWGEGARLMKWWTAAEVEGAHLRMLYLDGGSEDGSAEAHLEEAAVRGEYVGEGQRVRRDGSTFWAGVTLTALKTDDGELLGFAKVTRDLTAAHARDAALRAAQEAGEARKAAEEASRAKGEFLAEMTHELRTPLNAILGYLELLEMEIGGPLNDQQRAQLRRIRASGTHMLSLTNEILDLSRLESGRVQVSAASLPIGRAIEDALILVQPQAEAKALTLSDSVGQSSARLLSWASEEHVRQIVANVLANAVKFTPPGGRIVVSAGASQSPPAGADFGGSGPWVYIRVEDNGPGIPPDRLEAIFEPYEQARAGVANPGGVGLGLAISRRLARMMRGDLVAESEIGSGSAFTLWLPAAGGEELREPVVPNLPH
ncbi:MAG TPA: ATP-binding protein [Longimicrobium sp.]|nr:ATP-binding protein [Longimicrobium sp.]